jgi:hypothetical protein
MTVHHAITVEVEAYAIYGIRHRIAVAKHVYEDW